MAAPFYSKADQNIYAGGQHFIPQEQYRLDSFTPPAIMGQNTNINTAGITAALPLWQQQGFNSYEAWLAAQQQGGGGGDDPVTNTNRGGINFNLGPTNITDYEADAYGVGPTWAGSWARAKDAFSRLPTPGNLIMKGIRHWQTKRAEKKAAEQQAKMELVSQQSQANAAAAGGGEPRSGITASTTAAQAAGMGGGSRQATSAGSTKSDRDDGGWGWAQGGRIGYEDGKSVINYNEDPAYRGWKKMYEMNPDVASMHDNHDTYLNFYNAQGQAQGGRIGYRTGEFVDEDINIEGPGFDINENLMASDEWNDRLLEQLYNKFIDQGFSPADAEKMALDEFELMSQGPEQDQGIASLV